MEFQFSSHDYVTIQTTALDDPSKYVQCVFRLCVQYNMQKYCEGACYCAELFVLQDKHP